MRAFSYHRPSTLDEALALLTEYGADAKVLAGGQSLVPMMSMRLSNPPHLIDIGSIAGHDRIAEHPEREDRIAIGARVRHAALEQSPVIAVGAPLFAAAAPHIGHRAIRNRGTVCGSIAHADPAAELPAVALALDAELMLASTRGTRTVAARDFFDGYLTTAIDDDEILTSVVVPRASLTTGCSVQEISRRHGDFALVGVCASLDVAADGAIRSAALSMFGVASTPLRFAEAEALLIGNTPSQSLFESAVAEVRRNLDPVADNHASSAYRKHVGGVLISRALHEAQARATADSPVSSARSTKEAS